MRGCDLAARRYVVILALRQAGWNLKEACNHVAKRLYGDRWSSMADSIKSGFEKHHPPFPVAFWISMFHGWLNCTKENLFDNGVRLVDLANRIRKLAHYSQSCVRTRLYIHHFGEEEPAVLLADKMLEHAQRELGDFRKAIQFCERWVELSARAVMLLGPRIEKERSQWADAAMVKDQSFSEQTVVGLPSSIMVTATVNGSANRSTAPRARKSQTN
jgi:hypothetical protein